MDTKPQPALDELLRMAMEICAPLVRPIAQPDNSSRVEGGVFCSAQSVELMSARVFGHILVLMKAHTEPQEFLHSVNMVHRDLKVMLL